MGIDKIKLGPKSRFIDKVEPGELVAHPPVPGPANPTSVRGCGCGKWHVPDGLAAMVVVDEGQEIEHRYSKTCRPIAGATTPQPAPIGDGTVVLDDLVALLRSRSEFGKRKYGTVLRAFNGRDPYLDALQELLDLFVYLNQAQMEKAEIEARIRSTVTGWKFCPWCGKSVPEAARCLCPGWSLGKRGAL